MPPYRSFQEISALPSRSLPGTVLVVKIDISAVLEHPNRHVAWLRRLRELSLETMLLGHVRPETTTVALTAIRRVGVLGIRGFVTDTPSADDIRKVLAASDLLPEDVAHWLRLKFKEPRLQSLAADLAALACQQPELIDPVVFPRSLPGVPTLHKWRMLGKVFHSLLLLQTDPSATVEEAARASAYLHPRAFYRTCKSLTGFSPTEIQVRLGWEWILNRFIERTRA